MARDFWHEQADTHYQGHDETILDFYDRVPKYPPGYGRREFVMLRPISDGDPPVAMLLLDFITQYNIATQVAEFVGEILRDEGYTPPEPPRFTSEL